MWTPWTKKNQRKKVIKIFRNTKYYLSFFFIQRHSKRVLSDIPPSITIFASNFYFGKAKKSKDKNEKKEKKVKKLKKKKINKEL